MLVTKEQNDKAGNLEFARKLEIYFKTPGAPAVAINEDLRGRTEWKAREIMAREAELFQLIEELWQFGMIAAKGPSRRVAGLRSIRRCTPETERQSRVAAAARLPSFSASRLGGCGNGGADHAVARDEGGELLPRSSSRVPLGRIGSTM